jgi:hypothetical protein
VHSRRGKNKIGKKICGIEPMPGKSGEETVELLIICLMVVDFDQH